MTVPILELREICKTYGDDKVLIGINYSFFPGQVYGLVGPSGAGKSTILRILDLLENPTSGEVFYQGRPVKIRKPEVLMVRRCLAMVFQQPVLFSGTVLENVFYGLKVRGQKMPTHRTKLLEVLKMVGLEGKEKQKATTLSGGEAQRLALARVMVLKPEVLLLDEPTANLDPANILIIEKLLKDIRKRFGTTIIMVTHNLLQAKRLVDQILLINEGKLIESKPVDEMFNNPKHPFSKAFIHGEIAY